MKPSILTMKNVYKSFQTMDLPTVILDNVSVVFEQNNSYAIQGVSGTGKSTLIHILAGIEQPSSGAVFFNDRAITAMPESEHQFFLQHQVGLLFQQPYLIKELTVLENICLPAMIAGKDRNDIQNQALELLDAVGLIHKQHEKPATLSGGQQQRIALARALINKPVFIIADEPTGNLDLTTGKIIVELLISLQKHWQMGLIISTHDAYVAHAMNYTYRLEDGRLH